MKEGDIIEITIDRVRLEGSVNMLVNGSAEEGARVLAERDAETSVDPDLPPQTRLWALLQDASGGTWGGCVFDVEAIERRLAKTARVTYGAVCVS